MSLTSFIKRENVRELLDNAFAKPKTKKPPVIVQPQTNHYGIVGTAFDYLMRFGLQRWYIDNDLPFTVEPWVAESAMFPLAASRPEALARGREIIEQAKARLNDPETGIEKLAESALQLAGLDSVFRTGTKPGLDYTDRVGQPIDPDDVADLIAMWDIVPLKTFEAHHHLFLNPTFGAASKLVGGADADLILDGTIIDIKTTKNPALKAEDFRQIVGYALLRRMQKYHFGEDVPDVHAVGIYFARAGHLEVMRIENVLNWWGSYVIPTPYLNIVTDAFREAAEDANETAKLNFRRHIEEARRRAEEGHTARLPKSRS